MFTLIDRLLRRHPVLLAAIVAVALVGFAVARVVTAAGGGGDPPVRCDEPVAWDQAAEAVGQQAAVVGPVADVTLAEDVGGQPTFVNLGPAHPEEPRFDVVVYADVAEVFDEPLASFEGEMVCAIGEVRERDGVPQIVLDVPQRLEVID